MLTKIFVQFISRLKSRVFLHYLIKYFYISFTCQIQYFLNCFLPYLLINLQFLNILIRFQHFYYWIYSYYFFHLLLSFYLINSELLPLLEAGASWEVSAFVSQIYLPSSSGSSYPVFFYFLNIPTLIFQYFLYSVPHCNLYQFQSHSTHIYNFFLIISVPL